MGIGNRNSNGLIAKLQLPQNGGLRRMFARDSDARVLRVIEMAFGTATATAVLQKYDRHARAKIRGKRRECGRFAAVQFCDLLLLLLLLFALPISAPTALRLCGFASEPLPLPLLLQSLLLFQKNYSASFSLFCASALKQLLFRCEGRRCQSYQPCSTQTPAS